MKLKHSASLQHIAPLLKYCFRRKKTFLIPSLILCFLKTFFRFIQHNKTAKTRKHLIRVSYMSPVTSPLGGGVSSFRGGSCIGGDWCRVSNHAVGSISSSATVPAAGRWRRPPGLAYSLCVDFSVRWKTTGHCIRKLWFVFCVVCVVRLCFAAALIQFDGPRLWFNNTANNVCVTPSCFHLFLHGFRAQDNPEMCVLWGCDGQRLWLWFVFFVDLHTTQINTKENYINAQVCTSLAIC